MNEYKSIIDAVGDAKEYLSTDVDIEHKNELENKIGVLLFQWMDKYGYDTDFFITRLSIKNESWFEILNILPKKHLLNLQEIIQDAVDVWMKSHDYDYTVFI